MALAALVVPLLFLQGSLLPGKYLPPKPEPQRVLAKVDGVEIKAADIERLLWDWQSAAVLQEVILVRQVMKEAEKVKATVSDEEVERAVDDRIRAFGQNVQGGAKPEDVLRMQGFPRSRLFLQAKAEKLIEAIALGEFRPENYVKVSTLVIKPKSPSGADLAEALRKADDAYTQIKRGSPWDEILKSTTDDPKMLQSRGYLGWRLLEIFPESTRGELAGLKVGEPSKPVQTSNGIQIFVVNGLGKDLAGEELAQMRTGYVSSARQRILDRIRKNSKVEMNG